MRTDYAKREGALSHALEHQGVEAAAACKIHGGIEPVGREAGAAADAEVPDPARAILVDTRFHRGLGDGHSISVA